MGSSPISRINHYVICKFIHGVIVHAIMYYNICVGNIVKTNRLPKDN